MTQLSILVDGVETATTPFNHSHGRPEDLFLRVDSSELLPLGTKLTWAGVMPEGKTTLWVRIPCVVGSVGTFLLRDEDHV